MNSGNILPLKKPNRKRKNFGNIVQNILLLGGYFVEFLLVPVNTKSQGIQRGYTITTEYQLEV